MGLPSYDDYVKLHAAVRGASGIGLTNQGKALDNQDKGIAVQKDQQDLSTNPAGFYDTLQNEIKSGQYSATGETGKQSREALISKLMAKYAGSTAIAPESIGAAVYGGLRGKDEGNFDPIAYLHNMVSQPKTISEAMNADAGFAQRLKSAGSTIDATTPQSTGIGFWLQNHAPNIFKSGDQQSLEQAERNFVNAQLRNESGAAIADSEFQSAAQQYFPQPGDKPVNIAQKKQARDLALQNMVQQAGKAFQQPQGQPQSQAQPSPATDYKKKYNLNY